MRIAKKEKQNKWKEIKGITLIALVVTIVVLLILAAITINAILGDNGIFRTADEAEIEHRKGEILDLLNTAEANVSLKALGKPSLEEYIQYIQDEEIVIEAEKQEDDGSYLVTTEDGYVFSISIVEGTSVNDIVIGYEGQAGNLPSVVRVSKVTENSITVTVKRVDGASNISYGIRKVGEGSYNVVLPTSTQTTYEFTDLEKGTEYEIEVRVTIGEEERVLTTKGTTEPEQWDTSKVKPVLSDDDQYVPVPIGFTESTVGEERTVEGGFVIKQDGTQNEYVWIPANIENMYEEVESPIKLTGVKTTTSIYSKLRGVTGTTLGGDSEYREPDVLSSYDTDEQYYGILEASSTKDMADKMVAEYVEIHDSIEQYGGFYIGRYELTGTIGTPTVEKGGTVITQQNWYNLKKACMSLVDNSDKEESEITAKTTMIYGNQWDEVVAWLATKGYNTEDSSTWGNYNNYNDSVTADKQVEGAGTKVFEAGASENWKANNIYDFAGNAYDWTQEAYHTGSRVLRGGSYNYSGSGSPASYRAFNIPYDNNPRISARPTLYISSTEQ